MRNAGKVKAFDRTIFLSFLSLSIGYKQQKKENKLFTPFFFLPQFYKHGLYICLVLVYKLFPNLLVEVWFSSPPNSVG